MQGAEGVLAPWPHAPVLGPGHPTQPVPAPAHALTCLQPPVQVRTSGLQGLGEGWAEGRARRRGGRSVPAIPSCHPPCSFLQSQVDGSAADWEEVLLRVYPVGGLTNADRAMNADLAFRVRPLSPNASSNRPH